MSEVEAGLVMEAEDEADGDVAGFDMTTVTESRCYRDFQRREDFKVLMGGRLDDFISPIFRVP